MIYQISRIFLRSDPLTNIHMPDVPTLATNTATNAATNILAVTNQTVKGTNGMNAQDLAREVGPLYQKISGKEVSAKGRKDTIEITSNDRSNSLIVLSSAVSRPM